MLYTRSDLINAIIAQATTAEEDWIIANLNEVATVSSVKYTTLSGITTTPDNCYVILTADLDDTEGEIYFNTLSGVFTSASGIILIDDEQIYFNQIVLVSGVETSFSGCVRGYNGTTATTHTSGTISQITTFYGDLYYDYWDYIIISGTTSDITNWRATNYEHVYNQALRAQYGLVITDSNSPHTTIPDWGTLLDSIQNSGTLTYNNGDWIKYELPNTSNVDRVAVYVGSTANVYFAHSTNDIDWIYLKAEADHTLDNTNRMLTAVSESDAITNYLTLTNVSGTANNIRFPLGVRAKFMKIFFLTDSVPLYELVYSYVDIPEQLVVDYLSAISTDVGLLTAGVIQSSNFSTSGGVKMDLNNDKIEVYDGASTLRVRLGKLA